MRPLLFRCWGVTNSGSLLREEGDQQADQNCHVIPHYDALAGTHISFFVRRSRVLAGAILRPNVQGGAHLSLQRPGVANFGFSD